MPTAKQLGTRHPDYNGKRLEHYEALYQGGREFAERAGDFLPPSAVEHPDLYRERIARATYANHVRGIVGLTAATVTQEAPTVGGLDTPTTERITANADGAGTSLSAWCRRQLADGLAYGRSWAWVDKPRRPEGVEVIDRATEDRLGLNNAVIRRVDAECVTNWSARADGSVEWAILADCYTRQAGPLARQERVHRWRTFEASGIVTTYEWVETDTKKQPDADDEIPQTDVYPTGYGCPLVLLDVPSDLHLLEHMHDAAVALLRADNDLGWALWRSASELLVVISAWDPGQIKIGQGFFLQLSRDDNGADDARYVGPSGVALEHLAADKDTRTTELYRVVQSVALAADTTSTTQRQSGESKAMDWQAMDRMLVAFADLIRDHVTDVLAMVAKATGQPDAVTVSGFTDLATDDLAEALQAGALAVEAKGSPRFRTELGVIQATKVLGKRADPETLKVIRGELEQAETMAPEQPGPAE